MLNYIWAGLIIFSLGFALTNDIRDLSRDTYRNGRSLPVRIEAAGNKPKLIDEYVGRVNTQTAGVSTTAVASLDRRIVTTVPIA